MKTLILLFLFVSVFALSISPNYVRMQVGSNQTLEINVKGVGKVYDLQMAGPYLSWTSKRIWAGPNGKTEKVVFSPTEVGDYILTATFDDKTYDITAVVYESENSDILTRIRELRSKTKDASILAKLDKAEMYFNQSRTELAEIELNEIGNMNLTSPKKPIAINGVLLIVLLIGVVIAAKLLLG